MSVHVSFRELFNSFVRLSRDSRAVMGPTAHLLAFYAVECGLKAALLKRSNVRSTRNLNAALTSGSSGHDLRALAKELNVAGGTYEGIASCRTARSTDQIGSTEIHQAWRYGAGLDSTDEATFVAGLTRLSAWCREELGL